MELPIRQKRKDGNYYLRTTWKNHQREASLGTNEKKKAKSRAIRFLKTLEDNDWDTAVSEAKGERVVKAGADLTYDQFKQVYRDYCNQSANSPREQTIRSYLNRLRLIMERLDVQTIGKIDKNKLHKAWFKGKSPTLEQNRTFSSAVRDAQSCFKRNALSYYQNRGLPIENPFKGMDLVNPKVSEYVPISDKLRKTIWSDCQKELPPDQAMIVLMALGIGMRASEINAAPTTWFSEQDDKVMVHIRQETWFTPKSNRDGSVPISISLYKTLLRLRGNSNSLWFVPWGGEKDSRKRLRRRQDAVVKWLRAKGMNDSKPLHALRKEMGSLVAKKHGVLEASKILRNTVNVCSTHYAGIAETHTLEDIGKSTNESILEAAAKELGVSVEVLRKLECKKQKNQHLTQKSP